MSDVIDGLTRCFNRLTARQKERLRWHREKGTRVLCGAIATERYIHGGTG